MLDRDHIKEYIGGFLILLLGAGAFVLGSQYSIGSLRQMGPGFFPVSLGAILSLLGVALLVGARIASPASTGGARVAPSPPTEAPTGFELRGPIAIVLSLAVFAVIGEYGGLVPATFAIVFISAIGERKNTIKNALVLAVIMVVVSVAVFAWGLGVQIPLFRFPWFG